MNQPSNADEARGSGQVWEPANDTEWAMARAMGSGDAAGYFRTLALADLFLPQLLGDAPERRQRLLTTELMGQTFLPVFTSVEAMAAQSGAAADGYVVTNYAELRRNWPDPGWRLAVNPGTPIDAYVPVEAVEAAAVGDLTIPTQAEATAEALTEALTRTDANLSVDVDAFVETLLDSVVLVPTTRAVADPYDVLEFDFPWRVGGPAEAPYVEVFTSADLLAVAYPEPVPSVTVAFPVVAAMWPPGHSLSLNPRTPDAWELPAEHVPLLLLWGSDADEDADEDVGKDVDNDHPAGARVRDREDLAP